MSLLERLEKVIYTQVDNSNGQFVLNANAKEFVPSSILQETGELSLSTPDKPISLSMTEYKIPSRDAVMQPDEPECITRLKNTVYRKQSLEQDCEDKYLKYIRENEISTRNRRSYKYLLKTSCFNLNNDENNIDVAYYDDFETAVYMGTKFVSNVYTVFQIPVDRNCYSNLKNMLDCVYNGLLKEPHDFIDIGQNKVNVKILICEVEI
jgi:hypothetical protein